MRQALGLVESAWFFRRGEQSVRIVRLKHRNLKTSLRVDGPGASHVTHRFDDQVACSIHQSEIERRLVGRAFYLERASGSAVKAAPAPPMTASDLRLLFAGPGDGPSTDPPAAA